MSMSAEQRRKMTLTTRPMAFALLDDAAHLHHLTKQREPSRGDLRRLSAVLRRILLDGDLPAVAAPRMGKFWIEGPDNSIWYDASTDKPIKLFASGGATIFGASSVMIYGVALSDAQLQHLSATGRRLARMRIDNFIHQRVLCYNDVWISRREAIKYVANVASGVHSGSPSSPAEKALHEMSSRVNLAALPNEGGQPGLAISTRMEPTDDPLRYDPSHINLALAEVLAAALFLVRSPDFERLLRLIQQEVAEA